MQMMLCSLPSQTQKLVPRQWVCNSKYACSDIHSDKLQSSFAINRIQFEVECARPNAAIAPCWVSVCCADERRVKHVLRAFKVCSMLMWVTLANLLMLLGGANELPLSFLNRDSQ